MTATLCRLLRCLGSRPLWNLAIASVASWTPLCAVCSCWCNFACLHCSSGATGGKPVLTVPRLLSISPNGVHGGIPLGNPAAAPIGPGVTVVIFVVWAPVVSVFFYLAAPVFFFLLAAPLQ